MFFKEPKEIKILIVDDQIYNIVVLEEMLDFIGIKSVYQALSGYKALE